MSESSVYKGVNRTLSYGDKGKAISLQCPHADLKGFKRKYHKGPEGDCLDLKKESIEDLFGHIIFASKYTVFVVSKEKHLLSEPNDKLNTNP